MLCPSRGEIASYILYIDYFVALGYEVTCKDSLSGDEVTGEGAVIYLLYTTGRASGL